MVVQRHKSERFSQGVFLQGRILEDRVSPSSFLSKYQHPGRHEACFLQVLSEVTLWPVHAVASWVWVLMVLLIVSLVVSGPVPPAMASELS